MAKVYTQAEVDALLAKRFGTKEFKVEVITFIPKRNNPEGKKVPIAGFSGPFKSFGLGRAKLSAILDHADAVRKVMESLPVGDPE